MQQLLTSASGERVPKADIAVHRQPMIRILEMEGICVREDVLFSNHKYDEKKRIRARNEKRLKILRPALERVMLPGEAVFYIARGRRPLSLLEQLTAGWWTYLLAGATVVFTNKRILFFPVNHDGSWKESVRAVQWGDVSEIKTGGWLTRNVTLKYRNGKTETYMSFSIADGKKLAAIAPALMQAGSGEQSPAQCAVQLCPDCRAVLTPGIYRCGNCGLVFKD